MLPGLLQWLLMKFQLEQLKIDFSPEDSFIIKEPSGNEGTNTERLLIFAHHQVLVISFFIKSWSYLPRKKIWSSISYRRFLFLFCIILYKMHSGTGSQTFFHWKIEKFWNVYVIARVTSNSTIKKYHGIYLSQRKYLIICQTQFPLWGYCAL